MNYNIESPWIKEREATICTWKPDYNRGFINNMNTSLFPDIMSYTEKQLRQYVRMLKTCGFTGVQLTDMCSAWRASGSWEFVHERYKIIADEAHKNGMKVTLWVWAAEFSGHGWHDSEVCYTGLNGMKAHETSEVLNVFNKYYDIYADMAGDIDRVIAHFFDPGNLTDIQDVIFFAKLLEKKFKAKKPDIKMGIDTWCSPPGFPETLTKAGLKDWMLMELPFLPIWNEQGKRADFRKEVKKCGCSLGSWGWYTAEYEIDQRPMMCVNSHVLKDVYNRTREQADSVMIPDYWSEMDSYHLLNIFSLYCAAQLLINPESDPDELLYEASRLVAGDDAAVLYEALKLIEDARSGHVWDTYWWKTDNYILRLTEPGEIYKRAETALSKLSYVVDKKYTVSEIPLPILPWQLMKLILPHLEQIKRFAMFRLDMADLEASAEAGECPDVIYKKLDRIWEPIPEFNCITGLWGQTESREQELIVREFCSKTGIKIPQKGSRRFIMKKRMYEHLSVLQRGHTEPYYADELFYEAGIGFGYDLTSELVSEMVEEGILCRREDGRVCLADWENMKYDFII